jgi:thiazole/oxazole-forming peptide maturase SagC family component
MADRVGRLLREMQCDIGVGSPSEEATRTIADNDSSWLFDGIEFHARMTVFESWQDRFVLFASSAINPFHYKVLNRASLEYGFPWMHAAIDGPFLLIGPIFVPRRSACYECFEQRVTMNLRDTARYVSYKNALVERQIKHGVVPVEPILQAMLASHAALEIVNFIRTSYSFVIGKVLSIFLPTMEFAYSEVLRLPCCPACSPVAERDDTELHFDVTALMKS